MQKLFLGDTRSTLIQKGLNRHWRASKVKLTSAKAQPIFLIGEARVCGFVFLFFLNCRINENGFL